MPAVRMSCIFLYILFCHQIDVFLSTTTTTILRENTTWQLAHNNCISNHGWLATDKDVTCTQISSSKVWIGRFQTFIWLQPIGCYEVNTTKVTHEDNIEKCLQTCERHYVGFLNSRCYCFGTLPSDNTTSYSRCKANHTAVVEIFVVLDLRNISKQDNADCVRVECKNSTVIRLAQTKCHLLYEGICANEVKPTQGIYNYSAMEGKCKQETSYLRSERICSMLNNNSISNDLWTGIKRYRKNNDVAKTDSIITNMTEIVTCTYGECVQTNKEITLSTAKCDESIQYACVNNNLTKAALSSSSASLSSTTTVLTTLTSTSTNHPVQKSSISIPRNTTIDTIRTKIQVSSLGHTDGFYYTGQARMTTRFFKKIPTGKSTVNRFYQSNTETYLMTPAIKTSRRPPNVTHELPEDETKGLIAGTSVAVVCFCFILIGVVYLVRRKMLTTDNKLSSSSNDNKKWYSEKVHQPSHRTELSNNGIYDLAQNNNGSHKAKNAFETKHNDVNGLEYAIVFKKSEQNISADKYQETEENEYNRLDHVIKAKQEISNSNVYDSTLGMRGDDDPTYNTAMHLNTFTINNC